MKIVMRSGLLGTIIVLLLTFTCGLTYLVTQQSLRLGANRPLYELAIDAAIQLKNGADPANAVPAGKSDITDSLAPFVMIYDTGKQLKATDAVMNNQPPSIPQGVLDYTEQRSEDRFTWQPEPGLRFAAVAIKVESGYIVAGQSLQETERLIQSIGSTIFLIWLAGTGLTIIIFAIVGAFLRRTAADAE